MRIAVGLVLVAVLAAGCGAPQKRHSKSPLSSQRSSTAQGKGTRAPSGKSTAAPAARSAPPVTGGSAAVSPPVLNAGTRVAPSPEPPQDVPPGVPVLDKSLATQPDLDPRIYRLAPGDGVHVDVFNEPELTVNAGIDASGMINYPLLGHIPAAGMTVRELEERMVEELKRGYLVQPSVRVSIHHFRPIFIMGSVRRVGSFPFNPGLTVEKALATAGGISEYGSSKKVYIQHAGMTEDQKEKVDLDSPVRPGDTIIVEERLF